MADFSSCEGVAAYIAQVKAALQSNISQKDREFLSGQLRRIQSQYDEKCGGQRAAPGRAGSATPVPPTAYAGPRPKPRQPGFVSPEQD